MIGRLAVIAFFGFVTTARADDPPLADYFRVETAKLAAKPLLGIESAEAWKKERGRLQEQMLEMLGLWPMPKREDLSAKVTKIAEHPDFVIENILYQSVPGLYVTGNLYRPKTVREPLPAILYVCGHSKVEKDGVIYGNKAHYQHHAEWYAANGYLCLVVDTLQLGELPGLHHGTYREGMWWWQSRGYTPAGVEAWNGVRGIDYLISRPEVDRTKIGVTGRSGGGATSWWVAAIDDRVAAAVPVAGITDLKNHVVDGVVEGHCDCMFTVNTYRWDYPTVAALAAPKPLLVENTDKDPIFPEDGVRRVYAQLEKVYGWYDAADRLGLVIGKGGHVDSEEVRHPSFAFFDKWLKGKQSSVSEPDRKVPIEELKVLKPGETPPGSKNAEIQETFVAKAKEASVPESATAWDRIAREWRETVRAKVFGGWPDESAKAPLDLTSQPARKAGRIALQAHDFDSQRGVRLKLLTLGPAESRSALLYVLNEIQGEALKPTLAEFEKGGRFDDLQELYEYYVKQKCLEDGQTLVVVMPRGIGPTSWLAAKDTHIRRRFALLGQTLDGMRVWDVRRALAAVRELNQGKTLPVSLEATGAATPLALWAAVFEPDVVSVTLRDPTATVRQGPAFLNLERILDMPQAVTLLYPRKLVLQGTSRDLWRWSTDLGSKQATGRPWPDFREGP
jgi:dienelactone hydrolase